MTDPAQLAKSTREALAGALAATQTTDDPPEVLLELAEVIAQSMGILHRIERSQGRDLTGREQVLANVRKALDVLQNATDSHPAIDAAMESVAASLSKAHALGRYKPAEAAPNVGAPTVGAPTTGAHGAPPAAAQAHAAQQPAQAHAAQQPAQAHAAQQPAQAHAAPAAARGVGGNTVQMDERSPVAQSDPFPRRPSGTAQPAVQVAAQQAAPQQVAPQQVAPQAAHARPTPQPFAAHAQPQAFGPQAAPHAQPQAFAPQPVAHAQPQAFAPQPVAHAQPQAFAPQAAQPADAYAPTAPHQAPQAARPMSATQAAPPSPQAFAPAQAAPAAQPVQPNFQGGPSPFAPSAERAAAPAPRPSSTGPVNVELGTRSASNFYKGLSGNDVIEHGGLFVATYKVPKVGTTVTLRVLLPGDYEFTADATVTWVREAGTESDPGFGARFTNISADGRQLVYRYTRNREPLFYDDL